MDASHNSGARIAARIFILAATLAVAACGGGGGGGSGGPAPVTGGGGASSSASSASASSTSSASSSAASSRLSLYVAEPVIANCDKGVLKDSERNAALDKVNAIRLRLGLPLVLHDASQDDAAAEAALYMVANRTLTSSPQSSGLCYTTAAASLAATSNIYVTLASSATLTTQDIPTTRPIVSYVLNTTSSSLSERRRLLNPFLGKVSFGRVDGKPVGSAQEYMAAVLKVIGNDTANVTAMTNDFVAYPYGDTPNGEFVPEGFLSFSAIANKLDPASNGSAQVDFSGATITVRNGLTALPVTDQSANYLAYGLANSLQWKVSGLQTGVTYAVQISNVLVNGAARQYNYNFSLQ